MSDIPLLSIITFLPLAGALFILVFSVTLLNWRYGSRYVNY